ETHSLELDRLALIRGDEEPILSETSMHLWAASRAIGVEEIDPVTGLLRRQYGSTEGALQVGQIVDGEERRGPEMRLESALADVGVAYVPSEDGPEGYARHFDTIRAVEEELLPGLAAPRDWGKLLPRDRSGAPRAVELGEAWGLRPEALEAVLAPLGDTLLIGAEGGEPRMLRAYETGLGGNLHAGFGGDVAGEASARIVEEGASSDFGRYADVRIDFVLRLSADRTAASQRSRPGRDTEDYGIDTLGAGLEQVIEGKSVVRWSLDSNAPARILTEAKEGTRVIVRLLEPGGAVAQQELEMSGELELSTRFRTKARVGSARQR
ncbi:MAG: hypothetical protein VX460_05180, partial [Planctomycetota bacterium]|nr:hypothetical protein [Planctomycetota bacterium]